MKKRIVVLFLTVCIFMGLFSVTAFADMGPKPSVNLKIRGLHATDYYVTLLSEGDSTGPYSVYDPDYSVPPEENRDIWQKFVDYKDDDGFYFLQHFEKVEEREDGKGLFGSYSWTYYPPERFKVLIYFSGGDRFVVSEEITETYAFDSYFEVYLSESGETCTVERSYGYAWEVFAFLVRLFLTIGLELAAAPLFGFKNRSMLKLILLTNCITQLAMNILLQISGYMPIFFFYVLYYGIVEVAIFAVEGTVYDRFLEKTAGDEQASYHPYLYALAANLLSFVMGYVISHWFPFVF